MNLIGKDYMSKWSLSDLNELTFVSLHVRRGDYAEHLNYWYNLTYVTEDYFHKATQYYMQQFKVRFKSNYFSKCSETKMCVLKNVKFILCSVNH